MPVIKPEASQALQVPAEANATEVTMPSVLLCHYISDDQLEQLGAMKKEPVMEIFLVSIGAFIGLFIPAINSINTAINNPKFLSFTDVISIIVFSMTASVALICAYLWRQRAKNYQSLVEEIRNRPRLPVNLANRRK